MFQSIPVVGNKFQQCVSEELRSLVPTYATLLKYTGRRFVVYALEQDVTPITKKCDWEHGWSVGEKAEWVSSNEPLNALNSGVNVETRPTNMFCFWGP